MAVKSVCDIRCFKDVKFGFTLRYIEIRNHFLKYHPPRVPAKACACICFNIIYTLYGSLLTFFKIKFLKNKPSRTTIRVSNSLDSDQDRHSVGLHLGSNCLQKAIGRRQNYPLACRVITGKYFSVQYIVLYRDRHAYVYHKYSDTLNTFNMLCPCFLFENH